MGAQPCSQAEAAQIIAKHNQKYAATGGVKPSRLRRAGLAYQVPHFAPQYAAPQQFAPQYAPQQFAAPVQSYY